MKATIILLGCAALVLCMVAASQTLSGSRRAEAGASVSVVPRRITPAASESEAAAQQDSLVKKTLDELRVETTPEQLPAFGDRAIDESEYEAAIHASMSCLTNAGIDVQQPSLVGWRLIFTFTGDPDPVANRKLQAVYDACYVKYTREIDAAWAMENSRVLTTSQVTTATAFGIACLQARGVDIRDDASTDQWWGVRLTNPPAFGDCANAVQAEFGALP